MLPLSSLLVCFLVKDVLIARPVVFVFVKGSAQANENIECKIHVVKAIDPIEVCLSDVWRNSC